MEKRIIPISLPVTGNEEWLALKEPLETGWLTAGPKVRAFEEAFAERHLVKHAIAVTSATTALHLALIALDIKAGDQVIVPAFTWVSTANVVLYQGAEVVFCDIDPITFNLDPKKLKEKIIKFREDELHHKDIAYNEGATKKGPYSILDKIIKTGSKIAINISEKI